MHENTIVTACDANYFWGAFLLCLSIRRTGSMAPVHVLHPDLLPAQVDMLEQLQQVRCIATQTPFAMLQKPEALLSADTTWVTWLDCDTIWQGDLSGLIGGPQPGIQIRVRGPEENAIQFTESTQEPENAVGCVPRSVMSQWREDVGELDFPRLQRMVVSNVIALHRDFHWLPQRWHDLMQRVSKNPALLVDKTNPAYRITDEAALTALLAYCNTEVPVLPYRLDEADNRKIIHFEGRPKPWQGWQQRYLHHYDTVTDIIAWGEEQAFDMPIVPHSMLAENKSACRWHARMDALKKAARKRLVDAARLVMN